MFLKASIRAQRGSAVLSLFGLLHGESSIKLGGHEASANCEFRQETVWSGCVGIGVTSSVFVSTSNTAFVSVGKMAMPTKLKLQTTTKSRDLGSLPKYRPPTHPGEMLIEEFLKPLKINQSNFAIRLGVSYPRLNEIVNGRRSVTPDTALRLARIFGMSAEFWLGLQQDWDLWQAKNSSKAAAIEKIEPLPHNSKGELIPMDEG